MQPAPAAFLLCLLSCCAALAGVKDASEYPLRVQILQTHWSQGGFRTTGYGRGNLLDGNAVRGFDYTFECSYGFEATQGDGTYLARWKQPETKLVIVLNEIGKDKQHECELKTAVHDSVYGMSRGSLVTYTREQWDKMQGNKSLLAAEQHPTDTDPAHYPVRAILLESQWEKSGGGMSGSGRGSAKLDDSYWAFEFRALCPFGLRVSPEGTSYRARWEQQGTRLLMLSKATGENEWHVCELHTDSRPGFLYLRNPNSNSLRLVSAEEYKARQAKKKADAAATRNALKMEEVEDMLRNGVPGQRIKELVQQYGVDFPLSDDAEARLRKLGADDALLLAVARAKKN